jgi:tetratricopeptide (TPR) repeat protein
MSDQTTTIAPSEEKTITIVHVISLCILVMALYAHTIHYPVDALSDNIMNNSTLAAFGEGFTWTTFQYRFLEANSTVDFSHYATYHFFGNNITAFRIVNILLHLLNAIFLLFLIRAVIKRACLFESSYNENEIYWLTFFGAAFFALHPIGLYTTLPLIYRSYLLATFFSILTILSFIQLMKSERPSWLIISALCYFLAVQAEPRALVIPIIIFFLNFTLGPMNKKTLILLLVQMLLYLPIIYNAFHQGQAYLIAQLELVSKNVFLTATQAAIDPTNVKISLTSVPFFMSLFNQGAMLFRYLYIILIPDLSLLAIITPIGLPMTFWTWPEWFMFTALMFLPPFVVILLIQKGLKKFLGIALLTPLVFLIPELLFVQKDYTFILARAYLMLASGFIFFITIAIILMRTKLKWLLIVGYIIFLFIISLGQSVTFETPMSLWQDTCAKIKVNARTPLSAFKPYFLLGNELATSGYYKDATKIYATAASLNPLNATTYYNLGAAYSQMGDHESAIATYLKASALAPSNASISFNLANTYFTIKEYNKAIVFYDLTIQKKFNNIEAHHNLARALYHSGQLDNAIEKYRHVLKIKPSLAIAHHNLGKALLDKEEWENAALAFQKAVEFNPQSVFSHNFLAKAYFKLDKKDKAFHHVNKALELKEDHLPSLELLEQITKKAGTTPPKDKTK